MQKYSMWFVTAGFLILFICGWFIGYVFLGKYKGFNGPAGGYTDTARAVNTELAGEQQQALSRTATAIDTVERIRGITKETDSALSELREFDRRSSNIYGQIRKELQVLEDYIRSINSVLSDFDSNTGGKEVNE